MASAVHAADRAQLAGVVADSSGGVLKEVSVAAVNEDTGIRRTVRTDGSGQYAIGALEPGMYKVTARRSGFQTVARLNVELPPGRQTRLDFVLPVGSIREVVTVSDRADDESARAGAPPSQDTRSLIAGRRLLDTLPLDGRGTLTLVELAPGTVATPASSGEAGQFSVNGQRANANYFSLDGVSANSGVTGSAAPAQFSGSALPAMTAFGGLQNLASLDSLQEVRVETSGFAPESGRMPGAQVRLTTRSGSNGYHGSLGYGLRNEQLSANDPFAAAARYGRAPLRLNQWSAAIGGKLKRDRTFFFAAWEGLRLRAPFAWVAATPSLESRRARPLLDAFPRPDGRDLGGGLTSYTAHGSSPSRLDSGSMRIDHALTPRVALFGRFSVAPSSTEFGYTQVEQASFQNRNLTLGVIATLPAGLTSDSRLKVASDSAGARWLSSAPVAPEEFRNFAPLPGGQAIFGISIGGVGRLLAGATDGNRQGQLFLAETLGWSRGTHTWRAGVEYQRLTPSRGRPALAVAGIWPDLASLLGGVPMQVAVSQADQASSLIETLSIYAQDTWRPTARLALTYGLRWEVTPAPSIRQSVISAASPPGEISSYASAISAAVWPTRYGQVAPRLGIAYRISDRSVLRAGWGIFYDLGFSVATDPINGFPFNRWQFGEVTTAPGSPLTMGTGYLANLRLPYSQQWNVAWEQAITGSDAVSVSYVGSAGRRLLRREAGRQTEGTSTGSVATNHGESSFHSLAVAYRRRLARGVEGVANYRWGHSIDNGSWDSAVSLVTQEYSAAHDRGASSFDVRHSFSAAMTFESRGLGRARVLRGLTADWKMQMIARARSGFPVDVLDVENALGFGWDNFRRPDLITGAPLWLPDGRLNPAAFRAAAGFQGTLGRNAIAGFGMWQGDVALRRRFSLADSASLEVGLACFSVANHPNRADPVRYRNNPFFGQSVSSLNLMLGSGSPRSGLTPAFQLGGPRSLELGVKVRF